MHCRPSKGLMVIWEKYCESIVSMLEIIVKWIFLYLYGQVLKSQIQILASGIVRAAVAGSMGPTAQIRANMSLRMSTQVHWKLFTCSKIICCYSRDKKAMGCPSRMMPTHMNLLLKMFDNFSSHHNCWTFPLLEIYEIWWGVT